MTHDKVINWMSRHGHKGYANEIEILLTMQDEIIGDAGRYWQLCPFTQDRLAKIAADIDEVKQAALDRYEDWATD